MSVLSSEMSYLLSETNAQLATYLYQEKGRVSEYLAKQDCVNLGGVLGPNELETDVWVRNGQEFPEFEYDIATASGALQIYAKPSRGNVEAYGGDLIYLQSGIKTPGERGISPTDFSEFADIKWKFELAVLPFYAEHLQQPILHTVNCKVDDSDRKTLLVATGYRPRKGYPEIRDKLYRPKQER